MDSIFILGRNPLLSNAEIASVFRVQPQALTGEVCSLSAELSETSARQLFLRLGGSIKLAVVDCKVAVTALGQTLQSSVAAIAQLAEGKIAVGASVYGTSQLQASIAKVLLEIKRVQRSQGHAFRVVTSREPILSSVVVAKNHLLDRGREFIIIRSQKSEIGSQNVAFRYPTSDLRPLILGHTLAVQDFEGQSSRDYGRPRRDPRRGILPIQLARILVNLALPKPGGTLLDPFCGIGTILQEALLLDHEVIGSDIDPKAIEDSRANLEWLAARTNTAVIPSEPCELRDLAGSYTFIQSDIRELPAKLRDQPIDAIVTEAPLGPPLSHQPTIKQISALRADLVPLYEQAFAVFAKLLRPGGRLVIALPIWRVGNTMHYALDSLEAITKYGFIIPDLFHGTRYKVQARGFTYGRPDQHVWREIVVCERI